MHRNIPKSSNFWPLKRPKNVIFKAIYLKFCTHVYQDVPFNIYYNFYFFIFENILKKKNVLKYTVPKFSKLSKIQDCSFVAPCICYIFLFKPFHSIFKTVPYRMFLVKPGLFFCRHKIFYAMPGGIKWP